MTANRPELPEVPRQSDEFAMLSAFLDNLRADLIDRTWGLTDDQLHQRHPPTTLTLARLVAHMTAVDMSWFRIEFGGEPMPEPYASMDWDTDPDAEMTRADTLTGDVLRDEYAQAIDGARQVAARAPSLDALSAASAPDGTRYSLRWTMIHMIEEYARHCGHADLIRESIDADKAQ